MIRRVWVVSLVSLALLSLSFAATAADCDSFADALVAHWAFEDASGSVVRDFSVNAFDGSQRGAVWTSGPGTADGALRFDGTDDVLYVSSANGGPPEEIASLRFGSISIWFSIRETNSGDIIPLLYFGEADTGTRHNSLIIEIGHGNNRRDRKLYFTIVGEQFCYDSRTQLLPETWYHYVAVVGPSGNTGYLNGDEMVNRNYNLGSDASYTDFFSAVPGAEILALAYGRYGLDDAFFHGPVTLSDVRIYNRALSAAEVKCLYDAVTSP